MPPRFKAPVSPLSASLQAALLAALALTACSEPRTLSEADAGRIAPRDPASSSPAARPVATVGPDDAMPGNRRAGHALASSPNRPSADEMKQAIDAIGKVVVRIHFGTDRARLPVEAIPLVDQIAVLLRDAPGLKLSIESHTDGIGDAGRNREWSDQQAEAVVTALIARGIDAPRLDGVGFGGDQPVADNATEDGRAENRRIELRRVVDME